MILNITSHVFLTLVSVAAVVPLPSNLPVEAQRQDDGNFGLGTGTPGKG